MTTISHALMKALRNGVRRCSDDALECLRGFVVGQWHESGGFCDRAGKADIYYTQFGLMLARALGMKVNVSAVERFCWAHDTRSFDLVHASCFVRSLLLARPWFAWLRRRRIRRNCPFINLIEAAQTPYEQFLALTLAQDARLPFVKKSLDAYRSADGLYANVPEAAEGGVNATSSAILVELYLRDIKDNWDTRDTKDVRHHASPMSPVSPVSQSSHKFTSARASSLSKSGGKPRALQNAALALAQLERDDGSFCANPSTPFPDILSTASAHFALRTAGVQPRNDAKVFVEECFVEDAGGFAASPEGGTPDLEYTVYGVILMGLLREFKI